MRTVFACIALSCATACGGALTESPYTPPLPDAALSQSVRPLRPSGTLTEWNSGIDTARRQVVRDAATWQAVWSEIFARRSSVPALPSVDFSSEMVLVAAMGSRANGGYSILVDGVWLAGDGSVVAGVTSTSAGTGCSVAAVIVAPVDAVVVPKAPAVTFAERAAAHDCE